MNSNKITACIKNWLFKAIVITVVPFLIGIVDNASEWKNEDGSWNNIFYNGKIWVIVLSILYVIYVIYLAYNERKELENQKIISDIEKERDLYIERDGIYHDVFESLNALMNISQKDINDLSKKIIATDNLELLNWNFESVANYICNDAVKVLSRIAKSGNDITVNIYIRNKAKVSRKMEDCIKMVAHAGGTNSSPAILYKNIPLNQKKDWQYAKLFLENNPKIVVYPTEQEIVKNFEFNDSPSKYDGEYTQYIGIPISCSAGYIISSLEIISHHGTIIADTKEEILELINKYIIVYRNYALLTQKIEKGLRAKRVSIENEGKRDGKK